MGQGERAPRNIVAYLDDRKTRYYACWRGDSTLVERVDDGTLSPPETIGSVFPGTRGSYALLSDTRAFFCLNDQRILQDFRLVVGDLEDEWEPGSLAGLGAISSPGSRIAATATGGSVLYAFFQDEEDHIRSVFLANGGTWQFTPNFSQPQAPKGASIYALSLGPKIHFFFAHQKKSIYVITLENGEWTEAEVALTDTDENKYNIQAAPSDDGKYGIRFTTNKGEVYIVDDGKRELQFKWTEDGIKRVKDAEGANDRPCKLHGDTPATTGFPLD